MKIPLLRTASGRLLRNFAKRVSQKDICIEDIAHGLANVCRFSGQCLRFYSVAAHSLLVSEWIEKNGGTPKEALAGLLHDASEAYIADLPSPIKRLLSSYRKIEAIFMKAIFRKYGLHWPMPKIVKIADMAILEQEKLALFHRFLFIHYENRNVKQAFLARFKELGGQLEGKKIRRRKTTSQSTSKSCAFGSSQGSNLWSL